MIILDATNRSLEIDLTGVITTNQLPFMVAWVDHTTTTYVPGSTLGQTNSTTAVTITSAPAASTQRSVKYINVKNNDTVAAEVTVQYNDNTTIHELIQVTLSPDDTLQYVDTEGWSVINTSGQKKSIVSAVITSALPSGTNNIGDVDVLTLPAITGAVTANAGTNLNTSTLAVETGGNLAAVVTALQIIDNIVSGSEAQVDIVASLPAGVNNIGDVDVVTMPAITGSVTANAGTNLNTSTLALEAGGNLAAAVTALQIIDNIVAGSEAQVDIVAALPAGTNNIGDVDVLTLPAITGSVTANAGTNLNTSALALEATLGTTNTQIGIVTETAPVSDTASSGLNGRLQRVAQRITSLIALLPTALVSNRLDVNLGAAPATVTVTGTVNVGTFPDNEPFNVAQINGVTPLMGTGNSGTGAQRVVIATDQPSLTNALSVGGNVAHDGVDSGNPQKIGYRAIAYGTNPTAVAAADRTDGYANRHGVPFYIGGHPNIVTIELAATTAQTDVAVVTVAGGLKIAVTQIQFVADNANTVDVGFRVGFGAANTPTTTGVVLTHPGVPAGSGISRGDGSAVIGIGADGEDLRVTSEVPTTGSVRVLVSYFTIES